jgi:ATP-dependent Clp protease, protease subunit
VRDRDSFIKDPTGLGSDTKGGCDKGTTDCIARTESAESDRPYTPAAGARVLLRAMILVLLLCLCNMASAQFLFPPLKPPAVSQANNENQVTLYGAVEAAAVSVVEGIHAANKSEATAPITLYVNSSGGSVKSGWMIVDAIHASRRPVDTVCIIQCASEGAEVWSYGRHRSMLPHATLLFHDGNMSAASTTEKAISQTALVDRWNTECYQHLAALIGMSFEEVRNRESRDWWVFADEAMKLKIATAIVNPPDYPAPKE